MDILPVIDKLKKHHSFYLIVTWYFCLNSSVDYIESAISSYYYLIAIAIFILPIILIYKGNEDGLILFFLGSLLIILSKATISNTLLRYFFISTTCCLFVDLLLYAIMKTLWINTLTTIGGKYIKLWNILDFTLMCIIYLVITYLIIIIISAYLLQYQTVTTIPTVVKFLLENKEFIGFSIVLSRVYSHRTFLTKT